MLTEDGLRSRSNGVGADVLHAQAEALGARLIALPTTWSDYEESFRRAIRHARSLGAVQLVFGDMRGENHRAWNEATCREGAILPLMPL